MKKRILFLSAILIPSLIFFAVLCIGFLLTFHTDVSRYSELYIPPTEKNTSDLKITFLGTSSLLFQDKDTSLLVDGFFTRPSKFRAILKTVEPDTEIIQNVLDQLQVKKLDAVFTVHSHYDHAMDSGIIAKQTGAFLVGSDSTAYIGLGSGLEEKFIRRVNAKETLQFGKFKITILPSRHSPHARYEGEVTAPISTPAKIEEYKEGGAFSLLIEREGKSVLVQGSAGFIPGALKEYDVDLLYLGVGGLGKNPESYREEYWKEVVEVTRPEQIVLIHWDDFFLPLEETLKPLPPFFDDFDATMEFMLGKSKSSKIPLFLQERYSVHSL
ncbi:MBL fold metallo-hydrolase [Leptospira idonii]|nr:MBL fold metallo-hydrolase [Leptospira idonii]